MDPSTVLRESAEQHFRAGMLDEAIEAYQQFLLSNPRDAEALFGLANSFAALGDWRQSSETFRRVIDVAPLMAAAHFNKANADRELGDLAAAIQGFEQAVQLAPSAHYWNNLGGSLVQDGRTLEARDAFRAAVQLDPTLEAAQVNLVRSLILLGDHVAAVSAAHAGLGDNQDSHRLYGLLGDVWFDARVFSNASACFERVTQILPNDSNSHLKLGMTYCALDLLAEADASLRKALELGVEPALVFAHLGEVSRKRGDFGLAVEHQRRSLQLAPKQPDTHSNLLLTMLFMPEMTGAELRTEAECWAQQHASSMRPLPHRVTGHGDAERIVRVGYVSGALYEHPVGLLLEPIVQQHDRQQVEVHCYSHQKVDDDVTDRLRASADHWTEIASLSDESVADRIGQDEIDVLVDLDGHSWPNRLRAFAYRPAPVQLTWMGYAATTGLPSIDGVLGDRWVTPDADERHYSEQIVRLPEHYVCFSPPQEDIRVDRSSPDTPFTLGCFSDFASIGSRVIDAWADILSASPATRLYLKSPALVDAAVCAHTANAFHQRGVSSERIRLEGYAPREDLLAAYREVDLCLNPFPIHGGMTTLESLWMGVPVVTLVGDRFATRVGESFLNGVDMQHFITRSMEEYCQTAVETSGSIWSTAQRRDLRARFLASPLCQAKQFTQQLEGIFRQLLERQSLTPGGGGRVK